MEFYETKGILHAKEILGHKSLNKTLLYIQLISFNADEFTVVVAHTKEKVCEFVEAEF